MGVPRQGGSRIRRRRRRRAHTHDVAVWAAPVDPSLGGSLVGPSLKSSCRHLRCSAFVSRRLRTSSRSRRTRAPSLNPVSCRSRTSLTDAAGVVRSTWAASARREERRAKLRPAPEASAAPPRGTRRDRLEGLRIESDGHLHTTPSHRCRFGRTRDLLVGHFVCGCCLHTDNIARYTRRQVSAILRMASSEPGTAAVCEPLKRGLWRVPLQVPSDC